MLQDGITKHSNRVEKTCEMERERGLLSKFLIIIEVVHQMCGDAPGAKSQTCALPPQQSSCEAITHVTHPETQLKRGRAQLPSVQTERPLIAGELSTGCV
ncbi:hypothetical protein BDR06DRAFT_469060 [Suillus hirtellus]|nr:hypothetical protein BDR06DRAFT_469060 [Suillus hirtellus]